MKLIHRVLCVSILFSLTATAQKPEKRELSAGTALLRFNLTSLTNPFEPSISFGVEYKLTDRFSISTDAGYIFYTSIDNNEGPASGILLRPAARYYFGRHNRFFLEEELHYKNVVIHKTDWVGRDCVNGVPAYEEYMSHHLMYRQYGFNSKWGYQGNLPGPKNLWFEVYAGLGWKYRFEPTVREANTCFLQSTNVEFFDFFDPGPTVTIPAGFRVMYVIGGRR